MCENHDGLSHRSSSERRRLHSPSVDEQETELEPSMEQDEEDKDHEQGEEMEQHYDGNVTPSRKKEIMVVKIFVFFMVKLQMVQMYRALVTLETALVQGDGVDRRGADVNRCCTSLSGQFRLIQQGHNAVVALVDLTLTNSSPFTPIHSGLYAYTALLINPADSFTVF